MAINTVSVVSAAINVLCCKTARSLGPTRSSAKTRSIRHRSGAQPRLLQHAPQIPERLSRGETRWCLGRRDPGCWVWRPISEQLGLWETLLADGGKLVVEGPRLEQAVNQVLFMGRVGVGIDQLPMPLEIVRP